MSSQGRDGVFERLAEILSKQLGVEIAKSRESQPNITKDFFISYHEADIAWAEWIGWLLEGAGYSTHIQSSAIEAGGSFTDEMEAIKRSAYPIVLLSPDFLGSKSQEEWHSHILSNEISMLMPVRVRESNVRSPWRAFAYMDIVGLSEQETRAKLLDGIRKVHPQPIEPKRDKRAFESTVPFPVPVPARNSESPQRRARSVCNRHLHQLCIDRQYRAF